MHCSTLPRCPGHAPGCRSRVPSPDQLEPVGAFESFTFRPPLFLGSHHPYLQPRYQQRRFRRHLQQEEGSVRGANGHNLEYRRVWQRAVVAAAGGGGGRFGGGCAGSLQAQYRWGRCATYLCGATGSVSGRVRGGILVLCLTGWDSVGHGQLFLSDSRSRYHYSRRNVLRRSGRQASWPFTFNRRTCIYTASFKGSYILMDHAVISSGSVARHF